MGAGSFLLCCSSKGVGGGGRSFADAEMQHCSFDERELHDDCSSIASTISWGDPNPPPTDPDEFFMAQLNRRVQGIRLTSIHKVGVGGISAEIVREGGDQVRCSGDTTEEVHTEWKDFYFNIRENVAQRVDAFVAQM